MAFALQVGEWVAKAKRKQDEVFRELAYQTAVKIVERTPFHTGNAKGAWTAAINTIPTESDKQLADDKDGAETLARIKAVIDTAKFGDVIYLWNNSPYAQALEMGNSEQAPAGMVRVTMLERQRIADDAARKVAGEP